jgi:hypothetical protein
VHIAVDEPISLFHNRPPSAPDFRAATYDRSRDRDQRTVTAIRATSQPFKITEIAEPASQQEIGRNKVPAKFEQGGFTSGRREGPQTLFPGTSPGNHYRQFLPIKTRSAQRLLLYVGSPPPLPPGISSGSSAKTATLPRKKRQASDSMARCLS